MDKAGLIAWLYLLIFTGATRGSAGVATLETALKNISNNA